MNEYELNAFKKQLYNAATARDSSTEPLVDNVAKWNRFSRFALMKQDTVHSTVYIQSQYRMQLTKKLVAD